MSENTGFRTCYAGLLFGVGRAPGTPPPPETRADTTPAPGRSGSTLPIPVRRSLDLPRTSSAPVRLNIKMFLLLDKYSYRESTGWQSSRTWIRNRITIRIPFLRIRSLFDPWIRDPDTIVVLRIRVVLVPGGNGSGSCTFRL